MLANAFSTICVCQIATASIYVTLSIGMILTTVQYFTWTQFRWKLINLLFLENVSSALCNCILWLMSNHLFLCPWNDCSYFGVYGSSSVCILINCIYFSIQNNIIYEAVLCFNWHRLSREEMRIYQFFLIHVQQPQIIYIGGVWELNMETCVFVSVYRSFIFYSFFLYHIVF